MNNPPETTPELPFSFGEGFLQDHAGHIISDPRIALIELIANAYDAGATKVDLRWPAESGQPFVLTDNGTGMTRPEFERRWKTLCYKRIHGQGLLAENPNRIPGKKRVAFGYSGKGRHGAFCFADVYLVETWKDGVTIHARVEMTNDHDAPFHCNIESEGKKTGHGTEIRADVQRNLLTDVEIKELIGSKFAVDPTFTILVNNDSVQLLNLKNLATTKILIEPYGEIAVHRIDSELQDRTTRLRGITWWVQRRVVGDSNWEGLDGEGAYLDGRTSLAKRFSPSFAVWAGETA